MRACVCVHACVRVCVCACVCVSGGANLYFFVFVGGGGKGERRGYIRTRPHAMETYRNALRDEACALRKQQAASFSCLVLYFYAINHE